jgi:hypothetical protein
MSGLMDLELTQARVRVHHISRHDVDSLALTVRLDDARESSRYRVAIVPMRAMASVSDELVRTGLNEALAD